MLGILILIFIVAYLWWGISRSYEVIVENRKPQFANQLFTDKEPIYSIELISNSLNTSKKKHKCSPEKTAIIGSMPMSIMSFSYVYLITAEKIDEAKTSIIFYIYYRVERPMGYITDRHMKRLTALVEDSLK